MPAAQILPVPVESLEAPPSRAAPVEPAGELNVLVPGSAESMRTLTREERVVLLFSSLGKAAALDTVIGCSPEELEETRESLAEKLEVPNVAAAVNKAILEGGLPLRQDQRPITTLTPRNFAMLQVYAAGGQQRHLSELLGERHRNRVVNLNRRLFEKMGAWGREHSVRMAYERGAFRLGVAPITLDHIFKRDGA